MWEALHWVVYPNKALMFDYIIQFNIHSFIDFFPFNFADKNGVYVPLPHK